MKLFRIIGLILTLGLAALTACNTPINNSIDQNPASLNSTGKSLDHKVILNATGEFYANWVGCDNENEGVDGQKGGYDQENTDEGCDQGSGEDDGCSGGCEEDEGGCEEGGNEESGYSGAHPIKTMYVVFNAQRQDDIAKGEVTFKGVGDDEGKYFTGRVTWVKKWSELGESALNYNGIPRTDHDLLFGGVITDGNIIRGCFLLSIRDNGQGINAAPDRFQYRVYKTYPQSDCEAPPNFPKGYPKGYPIALYDGNLIVH